MNWYELQIYFESVCNSFYIAYTRARRKNIKNPRSVEEKFWAEKTEEKQREIVELVVKFASNEKTLIITTKAQVVALLVFYGTHSLEAVRVINTGKDYLPSFPQDELSQEFLTAYQEKNEEKMRELLNHALE